MNTLLEQVEAIKEARRLEEEAEQEAMRMSARYKLEKVFNTYECGFYGFHQIGRRFEN